MQELPPIALVKTWLEVVQQLDFPISIREKRGKLLTYYFGSIKQAQRYVEDNDDYCQRASYSNFIKFINIANKKN